VANKIGHFVANKQVTLWPIKKQGTLWPSHQYKRLNFGRWKLLLIIDSNLTCKGYTVTGEGLVELTVKQKASSKQCILL